LLTLHPLTEVPVYGWIWRHLPGPFAVRLLVALLLLSAVLATLFGVVFPAVEAVVQIDDGAVE
jgi:hypothetical protein